MMSQLKTSYSLIRKYSGLCKYSFGILIIIIHRFILYMQGKWGNKKRTITLQHIFWHSNIIDLYSINESKTNYTCNIIDLMSTQNV